MAEDLEAQTIKSVDIKPKPPKFSPKRRGLLKLGGMVTGTALMNLRPKPASAESEASTPPTSPPSSPDYNPHLRPPEEIKKELIPAKELEENFHIKILDLPDIPDFVKLGFRKSAIKEHPFFELQAKEPNMLYVVLLDGPWVGAEFLTAEQRAALPEEAVKKLESAPESFTNLMSTMVKRDKRRALRIHQDSVGKLQKDFESGEVNEDFYNVENAALNYKYRYYIQEPSSELFKEAARGITYTPKTHGTVNKYVFLPIRNVPDRIFESGNERRVVRQTSELKGQPMPSQSYLNPATLEIDETNPFYPIQGGNTPSSNLEHEFEHLLGERHPYTDFKLLERLKNSFNRFQKGDDTAHWVLWETPEGVTVSRQGNSAIG